MRRKLMQLGSRLVLQTGLLFLAFAGGIYFERTGGTVLAAPTVATIPQPDFTVFNRVWTLVYERYVDKSAIDPKKMMYGAISGMLDTLGDGGHTRFSAPAEATARVGGGESRFEGIGATLDRRDGNFIISSPIPGSPAERAGLRSGDVILQVDGVSVEGLTLDQVISKVRGPKGTSVRLTILRPTEREPRDVTIVRAEITMPRTTWAFIPDTKIAVIRLYQFNSGLSRSVIQNIKDARDAGAQALILDVRDNPGGLLEETVQTTSQFLKEGNVLLEQDSEGKQRPFPVRQNGVATDLPIVVLTNFGTASAAEILAGALQDYNRATVIGTRTFGTGTVLQTFRMSDGSQLVLGVAQWLTPKGRFIKGNGIQPDVVVRLEAGAVSLLPSQIKELTAAQFNEAKDLQLQEAVRLLRKQLPTPSKLERE